MGMGIEAVSHVCLAHVDDGGVVEAVLRAYHAALDAFALEDDVLEHHNGHLHISAAHVLSVQ